MSEAPNAPAMSSGLPLHATWWHVLKPRAVVLANGAPAMDIVYSAQTLAEATAYCGGVPGGAIVMNTVVFINPRLTADSAAPKILRA